MCEDDEAHADHDSKTELMIKLFNSCVTKPCASEIRNWKLSQGLCFDFQKHYICLHFIGLAIRLKLVDLPDHVVDFSFNKKPKHGKKN